MKIAEPKKSSSESKDIGQAAWHYKVPVRISREKALEIVLRKIDHPEASRKISRPFKSGFLKISLSVAASFLILLACYLWFDTTNLSSGDQSAFASRLPDYSRVVLSANSSVSFKKYFWDRKIHLKGEAYFEIQKGNRFLIRSRNGLVEVLGTRFSISDNDDKFEVICYEGKVKAGMKGLKPETLVSGCGYSEGKLIQSTRNNGFEEYPEYAVFSRNYSHERLSVVADELEDFFKVTINLNTRDERMFSGTFLTGDLESAIIIISESLGLKYEFINDQIVMLN